MIFNFNIRWKLSIIRCDKKKLLNHKGNCAIFCFCFWFFLFHPHFFLVCPETCWERATATPPTRLPGTCTPRHAGAPSGHAALRQSADDAAVRSLSTGNSHAFFVLFCFAAENFNGMAIGFISLLAVAPLASRNSYFKGIRSGQKNSLKPSQYLNLRLQ